MELRLSIFLFFIMVVTVGYTTMSWIVYKMFAHVGDHLAKGVTKYEDHGSRRQESLKAFLQSTERAVEITEAMKVQVSGLSPRIETLQMKYQFALAKVDVSLERWSNDIAHSAECVRDAIAIPAERVDALSAGIQSIAAMMRDGEEGT